MLPILACYLQLNTSSFTTHEDWFTCTPPPLWFFSFPFLPLSLPLSSYSCQASFILPSMFLQFPIISLFFSFFLYLFILQHTLFNGGGGELGQVGPKGILIMNDEKVRKESKEMQRRREEGRRGDRHTQRKWKERGTNRGECVCVRSYLHACMCTSVLFVCVSTFVFMCVCYRICVHTFVFLCICVIECVHWRLSECVYVRACAFVQFR